MKPHRRRSHGSLRRTVARGPVRLLRYLIEDAAAAILDVGVGIRHWKRLRRVRRSHGVR